MDFIQRRNDALNVNPQGGDTHLSTGGSDWLWAVTALFSLFFLIYYALSFRPRQGEKIFHYLFSIALLVGAISYFAMASGLGYSVIPTSLHRGSALTYQIFFAKYIFWVVLFPVLIIALGLVSGVSWATILFNIFLAWIWVISYLCSAYTATRYKWGFYVFGTVAYLVLAVQTLWAGRSALRKSTTHATAADDRVDGTDNVPVGRDHTMLSGFVNLIWLLYPIAFAVSDGGNVISVTKSMIYFGVLDVVLLCGTAIAFLILARRWDYGRMNLYFTQYGRVSSRYGNAVHPEKPGPVGGHVPPATGTTAAAPTDTTAAPVTHGGAAV
ncbi:hypothetical protein ACRE_078550 [Hapsidospora chrysogenum ATCC 11550]|uniref:Uncharacterized protein n=1 Tax=Hapsidospora chrysogenum (strain ATCC 11550 / CBS 779.69 / DSM 880 / IAM 14645 / JCM 23072 / IMI 49137) TaxID=857340 RepID=A0A086SWE8_HAPC1|nr:hypothetical protein ACRE_078550 [Hapsidospora chrysogenum ATCC 11550]